MTDILPSDDLLPLVGRIVSAHVSNNAVPAETLPEVIRSVYVALSSVGAEASAPAAEEQRKPAVPVKKSVFPDYIICLEDGKKLKTLKRHLQNAYGLTSDEYRKRWGLPDSYPMTAPDYAARRSAIAKTLGLGRKPAAAPEALPAAAAVVVQKIPEGVKSKKVMPKKAGRPG